MTTELKNRMIIPFKGKPDHDFEAVKDGQSWYVRIRCGEHKEPELVRQRDFHVDLGFWYAIDLHPRFSILQAFAKVRQRRDEIAELVGGFSSDSRRSQEERREFLDAAIRGSRNTQEFLKIFHDRMYTTLDAGDRNYRVTNFFKDKFDAKGFKTDDFFKEPNQELRRLMLRSGLSIQKVLKRMQLIKEDDEGKIYEMVAARAADDTGRVIVSDPNTREGKNRYLYVTCPSTGQEYLLQIPMDLNSPKEARRWTFDLPNDAKFVKEA